MTTPHDVDPRPSAEMVQGLAHLRVGIASIDRWLRRPGPCPEHPQLTMLLTEISHATHHALVRITEAHQVMNSADACSTTASA